MPVWVVVHTAPNPPAGSASTRASRRGNPPNSQDGNHSWIHVNNDGDAVILARRITELVTRDGERSAREHDDTAANDLAKVELLREGSDDFRDLVFRLQRSMQLRDGLGVAYCVDWSSGIAVYGAAPTRPNTLCSDPLCRDCSSKPAPPQCDTSQIEPPTAPLPP